MRNGSLSLSFLMVLALAVNGCVSKGKDTSNTLHVAVVAKIKGMDPAFTDDLYSGTMSGTVHEPLLHYHYLKRPYELEPLLAEAMPEVSKDGLTYTFKLKKGVLFHDDPAFEGGKGREVTADDFVYSWKRLADGKLNSPQWWVFDGKIAGLNEWHDASLKGGPDYAKPVEGLQAADRYTFRVKLTKPSAQFIYFVAMTCASVVAREAVEKYGKEFINHAVGTGPFRLESIDGSSKVIFVRNPTYRKELYPAEGAPGDREAGLLADAGKPIPFVDKLVVNVITEDQPRWLNFLAGKLDISGIPKDNFSQVMAGPRELKAEFASKGLKLDITPSMDITHTSFNMKDPLVGKNKLLRQAMSLAFDEAKSLELFYNGRGIIAQGPIPPGIAGYDPSYKNPYRQFNVDKAKEFLAKAGFPGGKGLPPLEHPTLADSTNRQMDDFLTQSMAAIGIQVKHNPLSWPEFQAAVRQHRGHIWSYAWGADYPDAENFLGLFYSKNVSPGPNDSFYQNPEFDRLFEAALKLRDSPERTALYQKMRDIVVEDVPWIFHLHRLTYSLAHPWVHGYKYHELDHGRYRYVRVEAGARK
jgi:oligopeptide transport system substrate-binding protein